MKYLFIFLFIIIISLDVAFSKSDLDLYIDRANIESKLCHTHQKELMKYLIPLSEEESNKKERDFDAPKDLKLVEKILRSIEPSKMGITEMPKMGLEYALKLEMKHFEKLGEIEACPIFEKLNFFKAMMGASQENKWPDKLIDLLRKKILLMLQAQNVGIPILITPIVNASILHYGTSHGYFSEFKEEINSIVDYVELKSSEVRNAFKNKTMKFPNELEIRYSLEGQIKLNALLQKLWTKELGL